MTASLLLIDDNDASVGELSLALAREGYLVDHVTPGPGAIRKVLLDEPDLVILGIDCRREGWQFCCRLFDFLDKPLLLLLSTADPLDRVRGLELGADDCMAKPVLTAELLARVRALLRRLEPQASRSRQDYFVDGDLVIDPARREIWLDGRAVTLTPIEFRLLCCFTGHLGELLTPEQLTMQLWGPNHPVARDVIKQHVHQLRRKLEPNPHHPQRILTRRGEGYMFRPVANI